MSIFTGILLDVSGSMEDSIGDGVNEEGGTWVRSIFTVTDDLIKHDISNSNTVFAVGLGASSQKNIFDTLGTIQEVQSQQDEESPDLGPARYGTIDKVFEILESKGARTIRKWAEKKTISEAASENEAQQILKKLESDSQFTSFFVYDCLPEACRDWKTDKQFTRPFVHDSLPEACRDWETDRQFTRPFVNSEREKGVIDKTRSFIEALFSGASSAMDRGIENVYASVVSSFKQATTEDIKEVVRRAKAIITLKDVSERSVFSVQDAAKIIHGCVDERELTSQRSRELLKIVEPFIYGGTPLYSALGEACGLLLGSLNTHPSHHRLLFILSDGLPTDWGNISNIQSHLRDAKVTVVSCYIYKSSKVEPRRLYSVAEGDWEEGAEFLFNLSSKIPTELVTRAIFIKHGWQIDITNNETKLFLHVNHPDHLEDVCSLARNAVCCQDTLSDLLVSIDLDIYINQKNSSVKAHEQVGETCYANASAAVLHLAMHRIIGRDGGYPDFDKLRDDLIDRYGKKSANTLRVLQEVCPLYRLRCQQVDVNGAMEAIAAKRPVVARFRLTVDEWESFGLFYRNNPTSILKKRDLDISRRGPNAETGGHAVVLTSFNSECFRLMNSWGDNWADMGFFRVENAEVLGLEFYDVYWTLDNLSQDEKDYYHIHGSEVAEKLLKSLKALQVATFTCPLCNCTSKVTEFSGTLSRASCPKCLDEFSCKDADGNILALNLYLTSLSR